MRLDKYLSDMGLASRSDIKKEIRKELVKVNGSIVRDAHFSVEEGDHILYKGESVEYEAFSYYMMHKPVGVLSSTEDRKQKTVLDLITEPHRKDLFPVGRLDKDSEGLLLLMNDGLLAHQLLSPKKHVPKKYLVEIAKNLMDTDIAPLREGIQYDKDLYSAPASVRILHAEEEKSVIEITITEGKFHQIKKMFLALSPEYIVKRLKRIEMGPITLDSSLKAGTYRKLTKEEILALKKNLIHSFSLPSSL